jgi:hypothetical protein
MLGEFVGGAIGLTPDDDVRELAVCCTNSSTFQLAQLSSALGVVGAEKKIGMLFGSACTRIRDNSHKTLNLQ